MNVALPALGSKGSSVSKVETLSRPPLLRGETRRLQPQLHYYLLLQHELNGKGSGPGPDQVRWVKADVGLHARMAVCWL